EIVPLPMLRRPGRNHRDVEKGENPGARDINHRFPERAPGVEPARSGIDHGGHASRDSGLAVRVQSTSAGTVEYMGVQIDPTWAGHQPIRVNAPFRVDAGEVTDSGNPSPCNGDVGDLVP